MAKFGVKLSMVITPEDGSQFADYEMNYHNVSPEGLQELQHGLAGMLLALGDKRLPVVQAVAKKKG